jgi:hypothetical protein
VNQRWTSGQTALCALWVGISIAASWYAIRHGVSADQLFLTLFVSSVLVLGVYDTRHNQPTRYNLQRSWPFGSVSDDDRRGERTVASQALQTLTYLSVCPCLLLIAFTHP